MARNLFVGRNLDVLKGIKTLASKELTRVMEGKLKIKPGSDWTKSLENKYHNLPISTLLDGKDFLDASTWLYPAHRKDIELIFAAKKKYGIHTVITIEGIGSGKTLKNMLIKWIEIYRTLTLVDPQVFYGMAPGTVLAYVLMSRTESHARKVTFRKLLPLFDCPFFNEYFPPQIDFIKIANSRRYPALLEFPKNVVVFPGTGSAASALGYDILGAAIDEANYLEVTSASKKSVAGEVYDAAESMHFEIFGRMSSRFLEKGKDLPGIISMFSNPRYVGDFLERRIAKANLIKIDDERWIDPAAKIFFVRRPTWKAKSHKFGKEMFKFDVQNLKVIEN